MQPINHIRVVRDSNDVDLYPGEVLLKTMIGYRESTTMQCVNNQQVMVPFKTSEIFFVIGKIADPLVVQLEEAREANARLSKENRELGTLKELTEKLSAQAAELITERDHLAAVAALKNAEVVALKKILGTDLVPLNTDSVAAPVITPTVGNDMGPQRREDVNNG